jgi:hypothetical protein
MQGFRVSGFRVQELEVLLDLWLRESLTRWNANMNHRRNLQFLNPEP